MDRVFKFYAFKLTFVLIVIFILQLMVSGFTDLFVLNATVLSGGVWRLFSAMLLHGGLGHLMYNGFALVLFGSILERLIGGRKFLIVFFVTGLLANIVTLPFYTSSLGASGAIFGVIGALIIVRPGLPVWAFGLPMPIFIAGILWAAGDIIGAAAFFTGSPLDNTGNIAHLSGMAFGFVFGFFYRARKQKKRKDKVYIHEPSMRRWEDVHLG